VTTAYIAFVGSYTTDVIRRLSDKVGIQINERLTHFAGVLLVNAKDDGLGVAIRLFHEFRQVPSNCVGSRAQRNGTLEVFGLIFIVGNSPTITIEVA